MKEQGIIHLGPVPKDNHPRTLVVEGRIPFNELVDKSPQDEHDILTHIHGTISNLLINGGMVATNGAHANFIPPFAQEELTQLPPGSVIVIDSSNIASQRSFDPHSFGAAHGSRTFIIPPLFIDTVRTHRSIRGGMDIYREYHGLPLKPSEKYLTGEMRALAHLVGSYRAELTPQDSQRFSDVTVAKQAVIDIVEEYMKAKQRDDDRSSSEAKKKIRHTIFDRIRRGKQQSPPRQ